MKNKMEKVYCKNCKNLEFGTWRFFCVHDSCFKIVDTPYCIEYIRQLDYVQKNKYNNCKDYQEKKSWIKKVFGV